VIDQQRLMEVFARTLEETKDIPSAVLSAARDAVAHAEEGCSHANRIAELQDQVRRLRTRLNRLKTPGDPMESVACQGQWVTYVLKTIARQLDLPASLLTPTRKPRYPRGFGTTFTRKRFVAMAVFSKSGLTKERIALLMRLERSSVAYGIKAVERDSEMLAEVDAILAQIRSGATVAAVPTVAPTNDERTEEAA
jgi:hypothetical protein